MSKAVITFDMPSSCDECCLSFPVEGKEERYLCRGCEKYSSTTDFEKRPDYCPLRKMPERKELNKYDVVAYAEAAGFNRCIDAIEGSGEH